MKETDYGSFIDDGVTFYAISFEDLIHDQQKPAFYRVALDTDRALQFYSFTFDTGGDPHFEKIKRLPYLAEIFDQVLSESAIISVYVEYEDDHIPNRDVFGVAMEVGFSCEVDATIFATITGGQLLPRLEG